MYRWRRMLASSTIGPNTREEREAVLRLATTTDGVPVSDVLQTWLDVSAHPARGRLQADVIRKRAWAAILGNE